MSTALAKLETVKTQLFKNFYHVFQHIPQPYQKTFQHIFVLVWMTAAIYIATATKYDHKVKRCGQLLVLCVKIT